MTTILTGVGLVRPGNNEWLSDKKSLKKIWSLI
jgi:hypothetical protein